MTTIHPEDSRGVLSGRRAGSATLTPKGHATPLLSDPGVTTGHSAGPASVTGVRWTVWSNEGQPMWTFEAYDFDRALVEKRRLCAGNGYRSGWAHLRPVVG